MQGTAHRLITPNVILALILALAGCATPQARIDNRPEAPRSSAHVVALEEDGRFDLGQPPEAPNAPPDGG